MQLSKIMNLTLINFILKAIFSFLGELFVWTFCWFIALFYYKQEESKVTGYPSQLPGLLREHIDFPFTWASTFDDCADPYWYTGRMTEFSILGWKPFKSITQEQYETSSWYRYCARVLWLCRNPAYTLSRDLGYDQTGLKITEHVNEDYLWDTGYPNTSYWTFTNAYNEHGFLYQKQIHLFNQIFLELVLGYKVPWHNERKNRAMIAHRLTIKHYPKIDPKPIK